MALGNLVGGFLQGFAGAREQKLQRQQKQDLIKFQTDQYKKKLEEQSKQDEALQQLQGLLMPQSNPHSQAGNAPAKPKKSLTDFLVDPELQALLLQSKQMDMGDLIKMQGQQQNQQLIQSLMGGGDSGESGGMRPKGFSLDAQGRPTINFEREPTPTIEQSVGAQSMVDAQAASARVGQWLTNDQSAIGEANFADSVDLTKLAALATKTGEGAQIYDDLIRAVMNIVYVKSGKQITESEAARTIGPMIPQISDVTAAINLFGSGDLIQSENIKRNAASKLQSLQSLIDGTMESEEIQKLLKSRGVNLNMKTPPDLKAKSKPLPERKVIRFEDLPDG